MSCISKISLIVTLVVSFLQSDVLIPTQALKAHGGVTDMVIKNDMLYVATAASKVDIFDIKTKKLLNEITLPQIKDFMGDIIDSKVYSVDVIKDKILIVSQGEQGGRNIDIFQNGKLTNILPDKRRFFVAKAKFIDENRVLFALLSNQLYLYDIATKKEFYVKQITQSKFSDFVLDEKKQTLLSTDESGDIQVISALDGSIKRTLGGQNLDNVFQLDWKNDTIITAGQDRRSITYNTMNSKPFVRKSGFLVYSCGLSPSGKIAAYSSDEENNVTVFNTQTNSNLYKLTKNKMNITKILFLNEKEVFVASDDKIVNFYVLH